MLVPQAQGVAAAYGPQNGDEGGCIHHSEHQANAEIDQRLGGPAGVIGDPVLGVLRLFPACAQAVKALRRQPSVEHAGHDPFSPPDLQRFTAKHDAHADRGHRHNDDGEHHDRTAKGTHITRFEAVEEPAIPVIHGDRGCSRQKQQHEQGECEEPGARGPVIRPEPPGKACKRAGHTRLEPVADTVLRGGACGAHRGGEKRGAGRRKRSAV